MCRNRYRRYAAQTQCFTLPGACWHPAIRPGLTSPPPLRGSLSCLPGLLFEHRVAFPSATQTLFFTVRRSLPPFSSLCLPLISGSCSLVPPYAIFIFNDLRRIIIVTN